MTHPWFPSLQAHAAAHRKMGCQRRNKLSLVPLGELAGNWPDEGKQKRLPGLI